LLIRHAELEAWERADHRRAVGNRSYNAEQIELRLGLTIKHKAPRRGSWLGG